MRHLTPEERQHFTRLIIEMLDDWGLTDSQQVEILGLPEGTRTREIRKYRKETPLPDDEGINQRLDHLIGIADALHTSYPLNEAGATMWMNRRNNRFSGRTPLNTMLEDGMQGILAVRIHLDCAYDWLTNG